MLIVYLILLVISVFFYIMYVPDFSFYLMLFLLIMPVVLFILNIYISRRIKVRFLLPAHKTVGRSVVPVQLEVVNPTVFPVPNLEIFIEHHSAFEDDKKKNVAKINLPLLSKETQTLRMNIASLHLGEIDLIIKKCRVYDFLRLFKFKVRGKGYENCLKETTLFVYPQYSHMENSVADYSGIGIDSDEFSPDKKGDDPSQVFGIHEYIEGDKPNRIHWKLTAKQDQVMVKDYSLSMSYAVHIFVNLNTEKAKDYDAVIEGALSVSMMLTDRGIAHTVLWADKKANTVTSINVKDESEHYECAELLIKSKTYSDSEEAVFPFTMDSEQLCCGHLIIFSKKLDEKTVEAVTGSGYAARYLFAFSRSDKDENAESEIITQDNVDILYIRKDHIGDAFSDIVF